MAERPFNIIQVSTADNKGGAARVGWDLFKEYSAREHQSCLIVRHKHSEDPNVVVIPNDEYRNLWARAWVTAGKVLSAFVRLASKSSSFRTRFQWIGQRQRWLEIRNGYEDFNFPATWHILKLTHSQPDILHCHNLHGDYFDLRALPWLSNRIPVILTLHDAWSLSGHCAHSFDCERWKNGCGKCFRIDIPPAIKRDATDYNWRRKQAIYAKSKVYVATPSKWLMEKVQQSMLSQAILDERVIPYGIDMSVFHPADKLEARRILHIPDNHRVLLFAAVGILKNIWKDYEMMRNAVSIATQQLKSRNLFFIALGEKRSEERIGEAVVKFVPFQKEPSAVALYYQAADVYLHAARADTFPNTVLESLACGTPVVATAVGGIPEQIKSLEHRAKSREHDSYHENEATGVLVSPGDVEGMAAGVRALLTNNPLLRQIGENAATDARNRFGLKREADEYLEWYGEIREQWQHAQLSSAPEKGNSWGTYLNR